MTAQFWNGNMAAAQASRQARVQVIAAYPITPQTHTVEYLAQFVNDGELDARLVKVESEHSALSACAGASAVGARAFTASCSQGLQLMSEVMYFTSGMRFPVVMAIANRTLSGPGQHLGRTTRTRSSTVTPAGSSSTPATCRRSYDLIHLPPSAISRA